MGKHWARMITDRTWVDFWFVQATAWYLQLDMWIVTTSSTETNPYIEISGNLADESKPSGGPILTLGTKSNSHYQSLLPIEMFHMEFQQHLEHPTITVPEVVAQVKPSDKTENYVDNASRISKEPPMESKPEDKDVVSNKYLYFLALPFSITILIPEHAAPTFYRNANLNS